MIAQPIKVNGKEYKATAISMGNPHLVIFVEDIGQRRRHGKNVKKIDCRVFDCTFTHE